MCRIVWLKVVSSVCVGIVSWKCVLVSSLSKCVSASALASPMQLQGFCPPIIHQDDTDDENCVDSDDCHHHDGVDL